MDRIMVAKELAAIAKELVAIEFSTEESMREYLKQHPSASPANHHVKHKRTEGDIEREKFYDIHHASKRG